MKENFLAQQAETSIASQELTVKESKTNFPIVDVEPLNHWELLDMDPRCSPEALHEVTGPVAVFKLGQ